ncbi:MAG: ferrous iron transporter B, partial [Eubacteriales bacterium]|nr:ferrous iron transporter B [Eubacteriales bacterium]
MRKGTIALVGNPNSGKTSLFNALTGANHYVGNWPGVTVEKKEGFFEFEGEEYHVVDLPGTYSLGAFSEDEVIARNFILSEEAEVIIDVVDANNFERNLYLTTQLLEMGQKVVIALNMVDEAEKKDILFDIEALSKKLGISVVPTVATKGTGLEDLIRRAVFVLNEGEVVKNPLRYDEAIEHHIEHVEEFLKEEQLPFPLRWVALKVVEGDQALIESLLESDLSEQAKTEIRNFTRYHSSDNFELEIIDTRYRLTHEIAKGTVSRPEIQKITLSDTIDKFVTNKFFGIPIFAAIMFVVFQLTFVIGEDLLGGAVASLVEHFGGWL